MLQRQSSQAQATRRAWAMQNGQSDADSDIPSSPTSSEFSDDGAPPSPAASVTKAATPPRSTTAAAEPAARKNFLKASPKASPKSKAARKASKAVRPAPLKLTKSAFDTSSKLLSPTSDASRKKEVNIRPKPTMSDEEAADTLFRLISAAWRLHQGCGEASSPSSTSACEAGPSMSSSEAEASSSCSGTDSEPPFHTQLSQLPPIFRADVFYPTPGPEKSFHGFGAYQYEATYARRDSLESASSAQSANIMTPPVTPVLYASNGCVEKAFPPEGYATDRGSDFFAH